MVAKVSVIVPNYNHAPYLRQRLDSIFNQSFQDFEVIILDDCSTDNSKEIIEEYRFHPQTSHIIYNATNSGSPFKQWAKGFELAQGEYIWIAESDDWAEPNFLEEMTSILDVDKKVSLTFCDMFMELPGKQTIHHFLKKSHRFKGIFFLKEKQLFRNNILNASAVLFRKEILSKISNEYQSFKGSGDYFFWNEYCQNGDVFYLHKLLNHFRRTSTNTTDCCISLGTSFIENRRIYDHLVSKGLISKFAKYRILRSKLDQIDEYKTRFVNPETYATSQKLWYSIINKDSPASKSTSFQTKLFLNLAEFANICHSQLPFLAKVWKIFHLPNTEIRKKIFHRH